MFDLFTLMGARQTVERRRDAFNGHGYKVSATLPHGVTATLSVPRGSRSRWAWCIHWGLRNGCSKRA